MRENIPTQNAVSSSLSTNIVVLTEKENELINKILGALEGASSDIREGVEVRLADMRSLAACIARFPSLLQRHVVLGETRTRSTLIDQLIVQHESDKLLHLPSKATLGKSFLVAKYHTFDLLTHVARDIAMSADDVSAFTNVTNTILFTLMAEDVYLSLLDDDTLPLDIRRQVAMALIVLWEYRDDLIIKDIAPVLQALWDARKNLAPVFGTMMGTSELILISLDLDDIWNKFVKTHLSNIDVLQSLEEFLFGLPFEHIQQLREILREKGLHTINRDEIASFLHVEVKTDLNTDIRDFYSLYSIRRDNARARRRLQYPGPKNTLEDHYMGFVLEQYKEAQFNDIFAK